jgi:hypothetical protein
MSKIHSVHSAKHLTAMYSHKSISTTSLPVSEQVFLQKELAHPSDSRCHKVYFYSMAEGNSSLQAHWEGGGGGVREHQSWYF